MTKELKKRLLRRFVVADYYIKKTKDLLVYLTPPSLFGIPQATAYNAGNVENKGFELQLNWKDRIGNLSYNIGANASFNKNTMTFIGNENGEIWGNEFIVGGITTAVTKGEPVADASGTLANFTISGGLSLTQASLDAS